ncbi:sperm-associated antigen 1-like [Styela clava]
MAESVILPPEKDITVDKLDYAYIGKCSNEKELERILRTLKSGRDGFYPELISCCEKKLESINPNNRALRKQQPVLSARDLEEEERQNLINSMEEWEGQMSNLDQNILGPSRDKPQLNGFGDHDKLPPVRGTHVLKGNQKKKVEAGDGKKENPDRIKSYDYKAWDKYDVDKECEKVDEQVNDNEKNVPERNIEIPKDIDVSGLTPLEKKIKATREKDKGNEAFKSGDYEEALSYYCRSICLQPIAASFNNRALVYLRLEQWKEAKEDCNTVLSIEGEGENLKAMLRRASACKALESFNEAKADLLFVLDKEPNNARAKSILKDVEKLEKEKAQKQEEVNLGTDEDVSLKSGKKMTITEVEGESEEDEARESSSSTKIDEDSTKSVEIVESPQSQVENSPSAKVEEIVTNTTPVVPTYPPKIEELKAKAGDFFKSGRYSDACEQYSEAIDGLLLIMKDNSDPGFDLGLAILYNNRAACWLKQGNDRACVTDCEKVLEIKKWDAKALMRRASAYEHMEKYGKAWIDFKSAHSMDLTNTLAQDGANRIAGHLRELYGPKWREKVPKVSSYPHHDSGAFLGQNIIVKDGEPTKTTKSDVPNESEPTTIVDSNLKVQVPENSNVIPDESVEDENSSTVQPRFEEKPIEKVSAVPKSSEPKVVNTKSTNQKRKRNKSKSKSPKKKEELEKQKQEEIEKEEKRMKIRRELFEKLKAEGNEHVKKGDYSSAIDCYTRCIKMCPKEPASYTNRALCFLKLKKHISAVNDCTEAIKLDPVNVKAYYRRSLARKAEGFFKDAERDLKKLLEIDPANKAATSELDAIKKSAWDEARKKAGVAPTQDKPNRVAVPKKKPLVIEEVDSSSSSDEGEFILPTDNDGRNKSNDDDQPISQESDKTIVSNQNKPNKKVTDNEGADNTNIPDKEVTSKTKLPNEKVTDKEETDRTAKPYDKKDDTEQIEQKRSDEKVPVPQTRSSPSKTTTLSPFDFGAQWNIVTSKSDLNAYKAILDKVTPKDLPGVLSNKIDDHVISTVAKVALNHLEQENDPQRAFEMMKNLTKAQRFSMAAMFLSDSDKSTLRSTFEALSKRHDSSNYNQKELDDLLKIYGL